MSDFLGHLAARATGAAISVRPRTPARFEPLDPSGLPAFRTGAEAAGGPRTGQADGPAAPRPAGPERLLAEMRALFREARASRDPAAARPESAAAREVAVPSAQEWPRTRGQAAPDSGEAWEEAGAERRPGLRPRAAGETGRSDEPGEADLRDRRGARPPARRQDAPEAGPEDTRPAERGAQQTREARSTRSAAQEPEAGAGDARPQRQAAPTAARPTSRLDVWEGEPSGAAAYLAGPQAPGAGPGRIAGAPRIERSEQGDSQSPKARERGSSRASGEGLREARPRPAATRDAGPREQDAHAALPGPPQATPVVRRVPQGLAGPARAAQVQPPTIHVTIGRIEVRASAPAPQAERGPAPALPGSAPMSLEEYRKQREGRSR